MAPWYGHGPVTAGVMVMVTVTVVVRHGPGPAVPVEPEEGPIWIPSRGFYPVYTWYIPGIYPILRYFPGIYLVYPGIYQVYYCELKF